MTNLGTDQASDCKIIYFVPVCYPYAIFGTITQMFLFRFCFLIIDIYQITKYI